MYYNIRSVNKICTLMMDLTFNCVEVTSRTIFGTGQASMQAYRSVSV